MYFPCWWFFTNPFGKLCDRQNGFIFPNFSGWTFQKYLKPHHQEFLLEIRWISSHVRNYWRDLDKGHQPSQASNIFVVRKNRRPFPKATLFSCGHGAVVTDNTSTLFLQTKNEKKNMQQNNIAFFCIFIAVNFNVFLHACWFESCQAVHLRIIFV